VRCGPAERPQEWAIPVPDRRLDDVDGVVCVVYRRDEFALGVVRGDQEVRPLDGHRFRPESRRIRPGRGLGPLELSALPVLPPRFAVRPAGIRLERPIQPIDDPRLCRDDAPASAAVAAGAGGLPVLRQHDGPPVGDSVLRVVVAVSGARACHHSDGDAGVGQSVEGAGFRGGSATDRIAFKQDADRRAAALGGDKGVCDPGRGKRVAGQVHPLGGVPYRSNRSGRCVWQRERADFVAGGPDDRAVRCT